MLSLHPGDRLVRHINGEVVIRIVRRLNSDGSIEDGGRPLVRLTAYEAVELVKAGMSRPAIVRARDRDFPWRRFVILAERGGAITIQSQHLCERCNALWANAGIAGKPG